MATEQDILKALSDALDSYGRCLEGLANGQSTQRAGEQGDAIEALLEAFEHAPAVLLLQVLDVREARPV